MLFEDSSSVAQACAARPSTESQKASPVSLGASASPAIPAGICMNHRDPSSEFYRQCQRISFHPLESSENYSGNYSNYVFSSLQSITKIKGLDYFLALNDPELVKNFSGEIQRFTNTNRKILLLDLDETLIHADFDEEYPQDQYDAVIQFKTGDEEVSVGIFVRPGVTEFLVQASKMFEIGIYTASIKEYADAVLNYLDPKNEFFGFRFYRNNCISIGGLTSVKDLRIIPGLKLENVILVDNSMYSFANQLTNGVLINSFYNDKSDNELFNVLSYLMTYIVNAKDVREINEEIFGFQNIYNQLIEQGVKKL